MSEAATITRRISLAQDVDLGHLLGRNDDHLRTLESQLDIQIVARGHDVVLKGAESQVRRGEKALVQLAELVRAGAPIRNVEVRAALRMLADDESADLKSVFADAILVPSRRKWIAPKTQKGVDPMTEAPAPASPAQLRELGITLVDTPGRPGAPPSEASGTR